MADKNVEIHLKTTGGDQAAAEVRKVDAAVDQLAGGGSSSGKGLKALQAETTKVTSANVRMGTGMQNVGYQVQDLAVQIGSGTSAFRALGQQLPQLLSGFGPLGITLGTVAAVALPLAGAMFNLADGTEEAGEKADEAADKLKKLQDARLKKVEAAEERSFKAYLDGLDAEFIKITRNNDAIQGSIELLQAENRAKMEVQSAQGAEDLARIDASDKTDLEKIQARADVNRRVEREKLEGANTDSLLKVQKAEATAKGASDTAAQAAANVGKTGQELAAQKAEAEALKGKIIASDQASARLPVLDKKINDLSVPTPFVEGEEFTRGEQEAKRLSELKKAKAERDQVAGSVNVGDGDRKSLELLQGKDGQGGRIAETQETIGNLVKAAQNLAIAADKAKEAAILTDKTEAAAIGARGNVTRSRLNVIDIETDSKSREATKKSEDETKTKEDAQRRKDESEVALSSGALTQGAFGAVKDAGEMGAPRKGLAALETAVTNLSKNPGDAGNSAVVEGLLEKLVAYLESNGQGKNPDTAKIRDLERRFDALTKHLKKNPQ